MHFENRTENIFLVNKKRKLKWSPAQDVRKFLFALKA